MFYNLIILLNIVVYSEPGDSHALVLICLIFTEKFEVETDPFWTLFKIKNIRHFRTKTKSIKHEFSMTTIRGHEKLKFYFNFYIKASKLYCKT